MIKSKIIFVQLLFCLLAFKCLAQTYPLMVNTTIIPPVNPFISQLIESPENNLSAIITTIIPGGNYKIKLAGTISRISPAPISIGVSPDFTPAFPLIMGTAQPVLILNKAMVENAFGNVAQSNLVITGTSFDALKQDFNFKLPEGQYKICLVAYDYDAPGFSRPLSDPNGGCAFFNICYSAAPPQITSPVNEYANPTGVTIINSNSPVTFTWTTPIASCGLTFPGLTYNLELFNLYAGQTADDAVTAPDMFIKTGLVAPVFVLDTLLYPGVLQIGKQYVVRVQAVIPANNSGLVIDNNGYSRPLPFQFDSLTTLPQRPIAHIDKVVAQICPTVAMLDTNGAETMTTDPLSHKDVNLGGFVLHIDSIPYTAGAAPDSFAGTGHITWAPFFGHQFQLAVRFDSLKIAKDTIGGGGTLGTYHVYAGFAYTIDTLGLGQDQSFGYSNTAANKVNEFLDGNQSHVISTNTAGMLTVPLGLKRSIDGDSTTLCITNIDFMYNGTNMSALWVFKIPDAGETLALQGSNFCIKPTGFAFGKGALYLPQDDSLPDFYDNTIIIKGGSPGDNVMDADAQMADSSTYVIWDSSGIRHVQIVIAWAIDKKLLTPVDSIGNALPAKDSDSRVVATFFVELDSTWSNWIAGGMISPFAFTSASGFRTLGDTIFYDHDTMNNAPGMEFPGNVTPTKNFMGFYIPNFEVELPKSFARFDLDSTTRFGARDLILSKGELSTYFYAYNLLDINTGNMSGWKFSIDTVQVLIDSNRLDSSYMAGDIRIPISDSSLRYTINALSDTAFDLQIKPDSGYRVDIWKATVSLDTGCVISLGAGSGGFYAGAYLNATISLDDTVAGIPLNLKGATVKGLYIGNRDPSNPGSTSFAFEKGTWSLASPQHDIAGFGFSVNDVSPYFSLQGTQAQVGVSFTVQASLAGVISAQSSFHLYGAIDNIPTGGGLPTKPIEPDSGSVNLAIDSFQINNANLGFVHLSGGVQFINHDPNWGYGFVGNVSAQFDPAPSGAGFSAVAMFGRTTGVDSMSYWYVDADVLLPGDIPIGAVVALKGFGGGAYNNLKLSNLPASKNLVSGTPGRQTPAAGMKLSGATYTPSKGSWGMMATTLWEAPSAPDQFNADVSLNMSFSPGGNEDFILGGKAYFMDADYPDNGVSSELSTTMDADLDLGAKLFSFNSSTTFKYNDITGSIPVSVYDNWGLHQWNVEIGDPYNAANRVSVQMGDTFPKSDEDVELLSWKVGLGASAYFAAGNALSPIGSAPTGLTTTSNFPALPADVDSAFKGTGLDNRSGAYSFSSDSMGTASGLMLGADVYGNADVTVTPFYVNAGMDVGFDVTLLHDTSNCDGKAAGWDGWYANGDIYAYLNGDAGVIVDIPWVYSGSVSLMNIQAKAFLQGGLPNPSWGAGQVGINGSALDGMVKFNTSFNFSFGQKCVFTQNPLSLGNLFTTAGPNATTNPPTQGADVYDNVFCTANVQLNHEVDILVKNSNHYPINGGDEMARYLFSIDTFWLINTTTNVIDSGYTSSDGYTFTLTQNDLMKGNQPYKVYMGVGVQEYDSSRGGWYYPWDYSGTGKAGTKDLRADTTWTFTTGTAPTSLPDSEVVSSTPVNFQKYFLPGSFPAGVVKPLRYDDNNFHADQRYALNFVPLNGGDTITSTFVPSANGVSPATLSFAIPTNLNPSATYRADFWILENNASGLLNAVIARQSNADVQSTQLNMAVSSANAGIQIRQASSTQTKMAPKTPYYSLYFGTSAFNTLSQKIQSFGSELHYTVAANNGIYISTSPPGKEFFDACELQPYQNSYTKSHDLSTLKPLLGISIPVNTALQNDASYYKDIFTAINWLAPLGVSIDLGNDAIRDAQGFPDNAFAFTSIDATLPQSLAAPPSFAYYPASGASSLSASLGGGAGSTPVPANQIIWEREEYAAQDYANMNTIGYALGDFVALGLYDSAQHSGEGWNICPNFPSSPPMKLWSNSQGGLATVKEQQMCINAELNSANTAVGMMFPVYKPFPVTGISRAINFNYSYPAGPVSQYAGTLSNNFIVPAQIITTPVFEEK